MSKPVGLWGAEVIGLAFAFGWTPCIGPILAAILAVAASQQTVARGAGLLLPVYSLGLGIPFIIAAFAVEPFAKFLARFKHYLPGWSRPWERCWCSPASPSSPEASISSASGCSMCFPGSARSGSACPGRSASRQWCAADPGPPRPPHM